MIRVKRIFPTVISISTPIFLCAVTMFITSSFPGVKNDPELKGVIPNSFEHIFGHIARTQNQQYLVRASYLEIYMVSKAFLQ